MVDTINETVFGGEHTYRYSISAEDRNTSCYDSEHYVSGEIPHKPRRKSSGQAQRRQKQLKENRPALSSAWADEGGIASSASASTNVSTGRRFKDTEPSETVLLANRIIGGLGLTYWTFYDPFCILNTESPRLSRRGLFSYLTFSGCPPRRSTWRCWRHVQRRQRPWSVHTP